MIHFGSLKSFDLTKYITQKSILTILGAYGQMIASNTAGISNNTGLLGAYGQMIANNTAHGQMIQALEYKVGPNASS